MSQVFLWIRTFACMYNAPRRIHTYLYFFSLRILYYAQACVSIYISDAVLTTSCFVNIPSR